MAVEIKQQIKPGERSGLLTVIERGPDCTDGGMGG